MMTRTTIAKKIGCAVLAVGLQLSTAAWAAPPERHAPVRPVAAPRKDAGPRSLGSHVTSHPEQPMHKVNNPPARIIVRNHTTNVEENHAVVVDHRPVHVVDRDPRLRVIHRGYHPAHDWGHFHYAAGGWFHAWGISSWDTVGTVTCEAANEDTGELFPVSEDRDARAWDDTTVDTILDQALDDCAAEANPGVCTPATPSCSFQRY